ncbi:MAG: AAA family ATPase [Candidatus Paceibacterota bacterium]|jgi:chromosome segregation protein
MNFLKRLELNGFKSFAGKTTLDFPAGITAIVGPNGSGKSNIVDAIRWLLGEREAKNLRSARAEDLIFAGTPNRPRLGLAQASLHFENKNGFFPVDFSEISVSREVNRDNVSRYFLNSSEVRLKDIIDFFARARLGTKGFIIVSQGQSDIFIKATPSERREMIEEMLGLREYQLKKTRAENRLSQTKINLEKVQALLEEIAPHLRSLKRQTSRWEKRGVLEDELKNLENSFFGSRYHSLNQEITRIEKEIENHKGELTQLLEEKRRAEYRQKEVEAQEPKERAELKVIKNETSELLQKQQQIQKELGRLEAQLEIGDKSDVSSPSTEKVLALVKNLRAKLKSALENGGDLKATIHQIIREIDQVIEAGHNPNGISISKELREKFENVNKEFKTIEAKLLDLREKEKNLEKSQEHFYELFKSAMMTVENAKAKIEEWESANQKRLFEKERLEMRRDELRRQIVEAGRHPHEFESLSQSVLAHIEEAESRDLEKRIFRLRGDLASLGEIDQAIVKEAKETEERHEFLNREHEDIEKARVDLINLINELTEKIQVEFDEAMGKINHEFSNFFSIMFGGGHARLKVKRSLPKPPVSEITEGEPEIKEVESEESAAKKPREEGIEIELSLPRKRINSLDVLSGGERSLVGIAALFAMISVSPPPFLVLDEIDAALDERNTKRFAEILKEFSRKTQFVIVTHNRSTMEVADVLYGVTLNQDGTSKILSLKLEPAV